MHYGDYECGKWKGFQLKKQNENESKREKILMTMVNAMSK